MKHGRLSLWVFVLAGISGAVSAENVIVKDGKPNAEIVVAEKAPRMTLLAAEELRDTVKKISGAALPIVSKPSDAVSVKIYVGKSPYAEKLGVDAKGLRHGAYRMKSGEDWLVLLGNDANFKPKGPAPTRRGEVESATKEWQELCGEPFALPCGHTFKMRGKIDDRWYWEMDNRGSFNAVCDVLRSLGVRWYLPDAEIGEVVPKMKTIALPDIDKTVEPDFAMRRLYFYCRYFFYGAATRDEKLWQMRLGLNKGIDAIGLPIPGHGLNKVHQDPAVREAHPEWFGLYNGRRDNYFRNIGRPCLSSPELFDQTVRYVRSVFDQYDEPMVSIHVVDGYAKMCQCPLCEGKGTPERGWYGLLSDYVWDFVDRVAREVRETHPGKKIHANSGGRYQLPPTKIKALSPNVVVGLVQCRRDFGDSEKLGYHEDLRKQWAALMPEGCEGRFSVYDYILHNNPNNLYGSMPVFYPHAIASDLRELKKLGSLGEFLEVYRDPKGVARLGVDSLNLHVLTRLWWDADQNVDDIIDEYCALFYGPAKEPMKKLIDYSEKNFRNFRKNPETIKPVFEYLDAARNAVAPDSVYGKRVALLTNYLKPLEGLRKKLEIGRKNVPKVTIFSEEKPNVTFDGRLDEPCWKRDPETFKPRILGLREVETGRPCVHKTTCAAFWSGEALYLGIRCEDDEMDKAPIATVKNDDATIWDGDFLDIFIETNSHSFYQISINPAGAVHDMDCEGGRYGTTWSANAEMAVAKDDHGWTIEMCLPAAGAERDAQDPYNGVSGVKPTEVYPWYVNICRKRTGKSDSECSALSPIGKKRFPTPEKFAQLVVK